MNVLVRWRATALEDFTFMTRLSEQKKTKINCSSESVKTKNVKKAIVVRMYNFYKINFPPILKKLSQKVYFLHFPLFDYLSNCCPVRILS